MSEFKNEKIALALDLWDFIKNMEFHIIEEKKVKHISMPLGHYDFSALSDLLKKYKACGVFDDGGCEATITYDGYELIVWVNISEIIIYNLGHDENDTFISKLEELENE